MGFLTLADLKAPVSMPPCNICGGATYGPGPGGRMSATGVPPRCETCQSLERHRTLRAVHEELKRHIPYEEMSCLQLSVDRAIENTWFASRLVSEYDVTHSLDIQNLGLPSRAFDVVICNHVLEHVEQDRQAMRELLRVTTDRGFLQVAFPDPARNATTRDWGYPNWDDHGHYRIYGMDVCEKLREAADGTYFIQFPTKDPSTNMQDIYFFLTRSQKVAEALRSINDQAVVEGGECGNVAVNGAIDLAQERLTRDPTGYHRALLGDLSETATQRSTAQHLDQLLISEAQRRVGIGGHICFFGAPDAGDFLSLTLTRRLGEVAFTTYDPITDQASDALRAVIDTQLSPDPDVIELSCNFGALKARDVKSRLMGAARLALCTPTTEGVIENHRLNLAKAVLAPGGLIIVGGFLDAANPGATNAVMELFANPDEAGLRPVALSDGRLYLTDPASATAYLAALRDMAQTGAVNASEIKLFGAEVIAFSAIASAFFARSVTKGGQTIKLTDDAGVGGARSRVYPLRIDGAEPRETVTLTLGAIDTATPVKISATGAVADVFMDTGETKAMLSIDLNALGASRRVEVRLTPQTPNTTLGEAKLVTLSLT